MEFTLSVVIPNYNNEKYIKQCVESVINQSYDKLKQIIIVDDASTDNSQMILEKLSTRDSRIKCIFLKENRKVSHARNKGLSYVESEYVTFLDGDDCYFNRDKLKNEMELIQKEFFSTPKKNIIAYSAIVRMSEDGKEIFKKPIEKKRLMTGNIYRKLLCKLTLGNIMRDYCVQTNLVRLVNGYNEKRSFFEDYELVLKLARMAEFQCTMQYGTAYRKTENGLSNHPYEEQIQTIHEVALGEIKTRPFLEKMVFIGIRVAKYNGKKILKKVFNRL